MKYIAHATLILIAGSLAVAGCYPELDPKDAREAWGSNDDPSIFASDLEYKLDALPTEGESEPIPWSGSYWPTYEDSINVLWDGPGSQSAAAKYGEAFGIEGVEDAVSENHGIDRYSNRTACTTDDQCNDAIGEACAIREGAESGYCIPTWWGICHGWTPAAILEPEPEHEIEYNGVTFKVNDLKALMTLMYTSTNVRFLSGRCNDDESSDEVEYDPYDRPVDDECRDTNPGTFHVVAANYLGLRGESFAEDRTYDDEVWNQPMRGFEVTSMEEITALQANELVGVDTSSSSDAQEETQSGSVPKNEWAHFGPYTLDAAQVLKATMTGDGDADLYVRRGAQPTASEYDCRPYESGSDESCQITANDDGEQIYVSVMGYAETSGFDLSVVWGGTVADDYVFNTDAVSFRHVKAKARYITEANAETDGNLSDRIDSFTRTDYYEYVLELDAEGRIIGGEWIGSSKTDHPDFLWLPLSHRASSMAGGKITYDNVKMLLDMAVADENGGDDDDDDAGDDDDTTAEPESDEVTISGSVAAGEWVHYGPYNVGSGGLVVEMTGTGDADLYVNNGSQPTESDYDCRPYSGSSDESCEADGPAAVYVSVNGYADTSDFELFIVYDADNG